MKHYALRDWEWMIRLAAPVENPEGEEWLNNAVQYEQRGSRPTDWVGQALDTPHMRDVQYDEAHRSLDDDHAAFLEAYERGLRDDNSGPSQFDVVGERPQEWNPTGPERLASDEGWLLGPNKTFDFPDRESVANMHNGMHQRGFELQNVGTDEEPKPAYVHRQTGARIFPEGDTWQMTSPGSGTTEHASPASAAVLHQENAASRGRAEADRWSQHQYRPYDTSEQRSDTARRNRGGGGTGGHYRRETPDYIPKYKAQQMRWGDLFDEAVHGNEGHGREFERAQVKSVHNPQRGATGRLYGVHQQQWDNDFENDAAGQGKVAQAIYHYATPIAWKYHEVQPDGTYDDGKWRIPATSFGSAGWFSTGRVQGLMGGTFYRHPGSYEHLRDPQIDFRLHKAFEDGGLRRQDDQSYRSTDSFGNSHHLVPSQSGQTVVHTVTTPEGRTFTKRVPTREAGSTAFEMGQPPGWSGVDDPVAHLRGKNYRDSQPPPPRIRREVPLRIQPELPGMPRLPRNGSIASWADSLRD